MTYLNARQKSGRSENNLVIYTGSFWFRHTCSYGLLPVIYASHAIDLNSYNLCMCQSFPFVGLIFLNAYNYFAKISWYISIHWRLREKSHLIHSAPDVVLIMNAAQFLCKLLILVSKVYWREEICHRRCSRVKSSTIWPFFWKSTKMTIFSTIWPFLK